MEAAGITQSTKKVAVVTGSNKGIGLEICRQLASNGVIVILTARDENQGLEAVQNLKACGQSDILFHQLNVTSQTSIASLAEFIKTKFKKLDILVNNAGVSGTTITPEVRRGLRLGIDYIAGPEAKKLREVLNESWEVAEACLRTNYYGVKLVTEELIPLLQLSDSPRIVNVSSTRGQLQLISNEKAKKELTDIESLTVEKVDELVQEFAKDFKEDTPESRGWPINFSPYIVSKAALNGYTRVLAKNYPNMAINAVSPGFVKTNLNHNTGILTVEQGAEGPVMLALAPDGGPSGLFYDQMEVSTF
ncbi:(+)-neomenthol dehydrogenase-like isoform X3 [Rhododendron vialii]|uniref:(+)-neomenthol dehydrogenase-like isoform X3 n=1 Tax=Rhododendron vialii TaxID=182163 RepID=UPI0026602965|nr:(+)-neomenthol dehydrogenase-like isoform X3 [Rhododendron vialii]